QHLLDTGNHPSADLAGDGLLPVLYLVRNSVLAVPTADIFKYVTPVFTKRRLKVVANGGVSTVQTETITMSVIPCGDLKNNDTAYKFYSEYEKNDVFKSFGLNHGLCVEANE